MAAVDRDEISYTFFGGLGSRWDGKHGWRVLYAEYVMRIVEAVVGGDVRMPWLNFPVRNRFFQNNGAWGDYIRSTTLNYKASWSGPVPAVLGQYIANVAWQCNPARRHVIVGASNGAVAASELAMTLAASGTKRVCLILLSGVALNTQFSELIQKVDNGEIKLIMTSGDSEQYFGGREVILSTRLAKLANRIKFTGGHCEESDDQDCTEDLRVALAQFLAR